MLRVDEERIVSTERKWISVDRALIMKESSHG